MSILVVCNNTLYLLSEIIFFRLVYFSLCSLIVMFFCEYTLPWCSSLKNDAGNRPCPDEKFNPTGLFTISIFFTNGLPLPIPGRVSPLKIVGQIFTLWINFVQVSPVNEKVEWICYYQISNLIGVFFFFFLPRDQFCTLEKFTNIYSIGCK